MLRFSIKYNEKAYFTQGAKAVTEGDIEAFLAVVHAGNISAAAARLYTTQPALSRRLRALEEELGYALLLRGKGVRSSELTAQGRAFLGMAERWRRLWKETRAIQNAEQEAALCVSAIGSVATYLLPDVIRAFWRAAAKERVALQQFHSYEAYNSVAAGASDLALISDAMFFKQVETIPAFREPMVWVGRERPPGRIHPAELEVSKEIRLPWNPEFEAWHDYWFAASGAPKIFLDHMPLLESFLREDAWAVVPHIVARSLEKKLALHICALEEGPPDHMTYLLLGKSEKQAQIKLFLQCLKETVRRDDCLQSYL